MSVFSGPVDHLPFAPPLERWTYARGRTVYRSGSTWIETTNPLWSDLQAADTLAGCGGEKIDGVNDYLVFLGGRRYPSVSSAAAALLTTAGYGSYLS